MEIIDNSKSLLENLYFISGILILITIVIGLIQLFYTKKTLITNSKRDAATLAAQQVEIYMNRVIPLHNKLFHFEIEKDLDKPKLEVGEFCTKSLIETLGNDKYLEIMTDRVKVTPLTLAIFNSMEAFSVYFIKEVADEEIAFSSVGRTFTKSVESLYFDLANCRESKDSKSFQNLVELYTLWKNKLSKEKLQNDKHNLSEQLKAIESVTIKPIGTK
jgi:flagellin-specific chaperone FliS